MRTYPEHIILDPDHLRRVVEEIGNRATGLEVPAFVYDLETRPGPSVWNSVDWDSKDDVKFHALNWRTNEMYWMSLATRGMAVAIPMGHPNGEQVGWQPAPLRAGTKTTKRKVPVYGPPPEQMMPGDVMDIVKPLFFDPDLRKENQNIKFDLLTIAKYFGEVPPPPYADTQVMKHLLWEEPPHDLGFIVNSTFGFKYDKIGKNLLAHPFGAAAAYSYLDAKYAWLYRQHALPRLVEEDLAEYFRFMCDVTEVLVAMEYHGAPVRGDEVADLDVFLRSEMETIKAELWSEAGKQFEVSKPVDKGWFIFDHCGHVPFMVTPKKQEPSLAEDHLRSFSGDKRVARLMEYDDLAKLHSTYVKNYQKFAHNGRIHTSYKQHGTVTGRLAAGEPNLQNVPKPDTEVGKRIRGLFWSGSDDDCLVVGDYSQIELRVLAYFSGDPTMVKAFADNVDIHQASADTLGTDRSIAKNINFAIPFGAGAKKVHAMGGGKFTLATATKFYNLHKERFPRVWAFIAKTRADCRQKKPHEVYTILGRKRRLPKIVLVRHTNEALKSQGAKAERQAVNCFSEDVEALTQRGWIRGMELLPTDTFLTKNADTGVLEWRKAVRIWKYSEYTGPMVRVSNGRGFDVLTTPEHRWLTTHKKSGLPAVKTSEELFRLSSRQSDYAIHLTGSYEQSWSQYDVDFAALLGWVLTDGYYGATFVGIAQTKERGRKEIETLLDRMGLSYNCYEPGAGRSAQYKIHGQIADRIKELCPSKTLTPPVILGLGDAAREALFEAMMAGDGYSDSRSAGRGFAAGTEERADVFQFLAVTLGKTTRKFFQRYLQPAANGSEGCWQVRVMSRSTSQTPHCSWVERYDHPVWCVTVPNSFAIFRSNGMTFVSGNTRIQGSAADLIMMAMVRLHDMLEPDMNLILQVHDELVVTCPRDKAERCIEIMREAMEGPEMQILKNRDGSIRVPVTANIMAVDRWSEAKA